VSLLATIALTKIISDLGIGVAVLGLIFSKKFHWRDLVLMFETILFPIDHSRESRDATSSVIELVKIFDSRLVLLSVLETTPTGEIAADEKISSLEAVDKLLQSARSVFAQAGINAEMIEREGMPSFVICDVADEVNADLIIMGCRGLGLTSEGAAESVTTKVINLSPCPVLIIP
jgi:nucleotide-binding universal stress UspA family protein